MTPARPAAQRPGAARFVQLARFAVAAWTVFAVTLSSTEHDTAEETIRIWRIGSPHQGDTPISRVPVAVAQEAVKRGFGITIEAFPAMGFAATFFEAVARNAAPDILVFNNFGVMDGITTALGRFDGIGHDPALRQHFVKVTGAFDDLLGPERGWTYLFALSPNHAAARALALDAPRCSNGSPKPTMHGELEEIVPNVAAAYLKGDDIAVQAYSDPDRLPPLRVSRETIAVRGTRACAVWGNDRFAVASVSASYEAHSTLGHALVLLVLRRPFSQWQLLIAARDPISNGEFLSAAHGLAARLTSDAGSRVPPIPATLVSPPTGVSPRPSAGQRFGAFGWQSSPTDDVVAEIAEFAYKDDARLILTRPRPGGSPMEISAGKLWHTGGAWYWRIWSVSRAGDVAFSEARTFVH
jgi:hypothetical protein